MFDDGQNYQCKLYEAARKVVLNGLIFGTGILKFYAVDGKIKIDVIFPNDLIVDDVDARDSHPKMLYQYIPASKEILSQKYPKFESYINTADLVREDGSEKIEEPISVIEAWRLPIGKEQGRHVISISNITLLDEPWDRDTFPMAIWRWKKKPLGFWGKGICEILAPIQCRLNRLLQKIEKAEDLNVPIILTPKGSKLNQTKWVNKPWLFIEYVGDPPKPWIAQSISQEFYMEVERLEAKAYAITGISRMASQAVKPAGLNSGAAIREFHDIQSQRFLEAGQSLEDFFVECAEQKIELAKQINKEGNGSYEIMAVKRQGKQDVALTIKWNDVNLSKDKYILRPYPAGFLPTTPAGKIEKAAELVQAFPQMQDYALQLLGGIPDVDKAVSLVTAQADEIDALAEHFLDGGEYLPPEPTMNIQLALSRMQQYLTRATIDGAPEEILDNFREFIISCTDLIKTAMEEVAAPPAAAAPVAPPAAGPEATPGAITETIT
jgi:hypothetical protein